MGAERTSPATDGPEPFVLRDHVIQWPDRRLTQVAEPFPDEDPGPLFDEMWSILKRASAWGLAAPQINRNVRAIVVRVPGHHRIELTDPEIVNLSGFQRVSYEGCLSLAGGMQYVKVLRYPRVVVEGFNREGKLERHSASLYQAAAVQHEVEHLDGINIAEHPHRA